jgi:hypothetical protein
MTILPDLRHELGRAARRLESRRRPRWRALVLIPVVLAAAGGIALAATGTFKSARHKPFSTSQYRYGHCPANVAPLGPDGLRLARRAALRQAHVAYPGRSLKGAYVTGAHVVTRGSIFSADAERCGLLGKTVLVDLHLPAPSGSASMSQGRVYVSRIEAPGRAGSFQLWGLEH